MHNHGGIWDPWKGFVGFVAHELNVHVQATRSSAGFSASNN